MDRLLDEELVAEHKAGTKCQFDFTFPNSTTAEITGESAMWLS